MYNHVNENTPARIIERLENGWSYRQIGIKFGVGKSTIGRIKKRWNEEHVVKRRDGTGRKRCTTENDDAALLNLLRDNPFETAVSACEYVNFPGSVWTARKRIKCSEISNYSAPRKPYLSPENIQQRIAYAQEFLNKNNNFWKKVIFSDEKVFQTLTMDVCVCIDQEIVAMMNDIPRIYKVVDVFLQICGDGLVTEEQVSVGILM
ncbi:homeobox-like domain superfamily [Holotrichia oblita]|uniref:Homeobox-like domain superfamily n=1 Tax=Holotrichia oblita TaxID=644536 RepID=A0ACB9T459_HOLOL|nr:homeobox-like domain superfamily [Holotrichia oblita]